MACPKALYINVEASTIAQPMKNCGPNDAAAAAAAAAPLDVVATVTATVRMIANAVAKVLAILSAAVQGTDSQDDGEINND